MVHSKISEIKSSKLENKCLIIQSVEKVTQREKKCWSTLSLGTKYYDTLVESRKLKLVSCDMGVLKYIQISIIKLN